MKALFRAMPAFMQYSISAMLQYRGEILLWAVWGVVYPAIATAMWSAAVQGKAAGGTIAGFGPQEFAAYFLMTMIVGHFCTAWDLYEMGWQVQSGRMSPKLLRPMLPIWQAISDNIAYKLVTMVVLLPIWIVVALFMQPKFSGDVTTTLLGIVAALIGSALNFLWGYNIALAAFWVTRMDGIGESWHGMSMLFGGRLAPLTVLPGPLQWIAAFLPFQWFLWFPAATLVGSLTKTEIMRGLGLQLVWLVIGVFVFRAVWYSAVKRYTAVGA